MSLFSFTFFLLIAKASQSRTDPHKSVFSMHNKYGWYSGKWKMKTGENTIQHHLVYLPQYKCNPCIYQE